MTHYTFYFSYPPLPISIQRNFCSWGKIRRKKSPRSDQSFVRGKIFAKKFNGSDAKLVIKITFNFRFQKSHSRLTWRLRDARLSSLWFFVRIIWSKIYRKYFTCIVSNSIITILRKVRFVSFYRFHLTRQKSKIFVDGFTNKRKVMN